MKEKKFALAPCPACDTAGTEAWLTRMAREGWQLTEDGVVLGVGCFRAAAPGDLRYRLDTAPEGTSLWSDNGGLPEEEAQELYSASGWAYVANRGPFHIYCTADPEAPELHTDPELEAVALDAARKKQAGTVAELILWLVVFPLIWNRGALAGLLTMVELGTGFTLLGAALVLWLVVAAVRRLLYYRRVQNWLRGSGQEPKGERSPLRYWVASAVKYGLIALWILLLLHRGSVSILNEDKVAIEDYTGDIPFATILDFAGEGASDYRATMTGLDPAFRAVQAWSDPLAPENIRWVEHADVTMADGRRLSGGLYVDYHRAASPWIARRLMADYLRRDSREKYYEPMDPPELKADVAVCYSDRVHRPTVLFCKGRTVVRASFYQVGEERPLSPEDWMPLLAESIPD